METINFLARNDRAGVRVTFSSTSSNHIVRHKLSGKRLNPELLLQSKQRIKNDLIKVNRKRDGREWRKRRGSKILEIFVQLNIEDASHRDATMWILKPFEFWSFEFCFVFDMSVSNVQRSAAYVVYHPFWPLNHKNEKTKKKHCMEIIICTFFIVEDHGYVRWVSARSLAVSVQVYVAVCYVQRTDTYCQWWSKFTIRPDFKCLTSSDNLNGFYFLCVVSLLSVLCKFQCLTNWQQFIWYTYTWKLILLYTKTQQSNINHAINL